MSIGPSEVKISPRTRAARHPDSKSVYAQRIAPSDFQIAPCKFDWCCMDSKSVYAENAPCHAASEGGRRLGVTARRCLDWENGCRLEIQKDKNLGATTRSNATIDLFRGNFNAASRNQMIR